MKAIKKLLLILGLAIQTYLIKIPLGDFSINLFEILVFLTAVPFVWHQGLKNLFKYKILNGFLFLLIFASTVALLSSSLDTQMLFRHLRYSFVALVFVFILVETFKSTIDRMKFMDVASIGAALFLLLSIILNLAGYNVAYDNRLLGPLDSAVYMAFYLSPFLIYQASILHSQSKKVYWRVGLVLFLGLGILLTRSFGAVFALAIVLGVFLLKLKLATLKRYWPLIMIMSFVLLYFLYQVKIAPYFLEGTSSLGERFEIWLGASELLSRINHFFFGVGLGQFQPWYEINIDQILGHSPEDYMVLQPHNIFLLAWVQFGLLGFLALVYVFVDSIRKFFFKEKMEESWVFLCLLYFFLHGFIDSPIYKNDLLPFFLLLLVWFYFRVDQKKLT